MKLDQAMHERLCAYALGEADAAQRIEMERMLAESAELRAELETIEHTIGLVQETVGASERLSPAAEAALYQAVNPEPRRSAWYASGWMRMAAGFLVVGGSAMFLRSMFEQNRANMAPECAARLEEEEARKAQPSAEAKEALVAQLDSKSRVAPEASDRGRADNEHGGAVKAEETFGVKVQAGGSGPGVPSRRDRDAQDAVAVAGAGGWATEGSFPTTPFSAGAVAGKPAEMPYPTNPSVPVDPAVRFYEWNDTSALAAKQPTGGVAGAAPTQSSVPTAGEGSTRKLAALGYPGASKSADVGYKKRGEPGAPGEKGTYRGPSDTAPAGAGLASAGPAAPSSPAPMGPSTGSPAGTSAAPKPSDVPALQKQREQLTQKVDTFTGRRAAGAAESEKDKAVAEQLGRQAAGDSPKLEQKAGAGSDPSEIVTFEEDLLSTSTKDTDLGAFYTRDAKAQTPANEAQVRLRRLLERADQAGDERLALLRDDVTPEVRAKLKGLGYTGPDNDDEVSLRQLYFKLSPEERQRVLDVECGRVFDGCRRRPNERPRDMFFRYWGDNPFEITALDSLSTFAADVDTASYALARRYLLEGKLPEKAQIRTEEFVNYFKADVAAPMHDTFAIHTDLAPSRFAQPANSTWTLRVVVRGQELAKEERKPLHLTCVIDCSGSMKEQNRMETVKDTLRLLMTQLNAADQIGIVAFSTEARQILPLTSVGNRGLIETAIAQLQPDGWTNSEAGLKLGYETALAGLDALATNRVVFLSDGVANKGVTDPVQLSESLRPIREKGVYLNTIGVGMNNHNDALLEQLADKGDGLCSYVDDMREAKRVMMDNFMGSVETIARDVKIQVEFDPAQVARYRLLGYENRAVADADFRNDKVDAGEIGAGHQVTALYELERNLGAVSEKPLATVRLRYKAPRIVNGPPNEEAREIAQDVRASQQTSFDGADAGYRRAVIVGQFAEFLRRSVHARGRSFDELLAEAHKLEAQLPQDTDFHEFVAMVELSKKLVLANLPNCDELCQAIDAYRTWQFQCAQAERLDRERQQQLVDELARQNREMEDRIRELLRRRLESSPR